MEIKNVRVYGLEESIIASGYPMITKTPNELEFIDKSMDLENEIMQGEVNVNDLIRATKLANTPLGSGHYTFLKGIIVQYDLTAPEYFWRQFDRYHFHDYISSQSKMQRILKFNIDEMCNPYVRNDAKGILQQEIDNYNKAVENKASKEDIQKQFQFIISNCPMGIELTARITDNYLQLKSKYHQRRHHKLEEWQYYCNWIETLPLAEELIVGRY